MSWTVAGQPVVNYTFDDANRLTQIAQGTTTLGFSYDNANRRATLTLPNGIVAAYGYDNNSRLTRITYTNGAATVGNLTYGYDNAGRRTSVSGSLAQTGLPLPVSISGYNANNQLTTWGTTNLFYDLNGNMTSSGTDGYTWDARNRLVSTLSGASFQYDAFGRRTSKTIGGTTTNFLYDGANAVQEVIGGTNTANSLTGGIDEVFQRTGSAGARTFLTDALGSALALTDSAGTTQTSYTFDPFGNTTSTGAASTNSFQYTGRENDGTGLYFYRARYYNPSLQRFISEDPAGFNGGDINVYAYVGNSPTNLVDPFGLSGMAGRNCGNTSDRPPKLRDKDGVPCDQKILGRFNSQFGTNIPLSNTQNIGAPDFGHVADNINIFFPLDSLAPGQVQPGRFGGGPLGTGSTLHVARFFVGPDPSGNLSDIAKVHLDQGNPTAFPILPGAISHLDYVLTHSAGPCP